MPITLDPIFLWISKYSWILLEMSTLYCILWKKNDSLNKNSSIFLVRPDDRLIETITSLSFRSVGLSQTHYWVHFPSYFCKSAKKTTDNYSMCSCSVFLMIIHCKLIRKPSVRITWVCAFGNNIVTSHWIRVNSVNSRAFK